MDMISPDPQEQSHSQQGAGTRQPPGQSYPPPPPPPQRKPFNWLACCGISCVILLIVGGLIGYGCYRMAQPFVQVGMEMVELENRVSSTAIETIENEAVAVSAAEFSSNPDAYRDQWLVIEGQVDSLSANASFGNSSASGSTDGTTYVIDGTVIVIDITNTPHVAKPAESIRAYGQAMSWSMESMTSMPIIGGLMKQAMEEDPTFKDAMGMTFFIAKKVELIPGSGARDSGSAAEAGDATDAAKDSGWIQ